MGRFTGERRCAGAEMKSIHRSILARALMATAASLAFTTISAGSVRAEIVTVQGDDGPAGANGVNPGDPGLPGGDGESVAADAGSAQPITAPLNQATATGGNGGAGGNGINPDYSSAGSNGGSGGNGGDASANSAAAIVSGSGEAEADSSGGYADKGVAPIQVMVEMAALRPPKPRRPSCLDRRLQTLSPRVEMADKAPMEVEARLELEALVELAEMAVLPKSPHRQMQSRVRRRQTPRH
jgi:hypothetical protein